MLCESEGVPYKCSRMYVHQKFIYAYVHQRRVYAAISYPLRLRFPSIVARDSIFLVHVVFFCVCVCVYYIYSYIDIIYRTCGPDERNKSGIRVHIFLKNGCLDTPRRNTTTSAPVIFHSYPSAFV